MPGNTIRTAWPEPYLQPDRNKDCGYYAQAYLCRCLGHPEVTAEQVKAWRAEMGIHETRYAVNVLGAQKWMTGDAWSIGERGHRIFWLGQTELAKAWVRYRLSAGWIAQCLVHRIQPMGHAVVLLGCDEDGVQLLDPIYGHITEPWGWFLGPGPKAECADWPGVSADGRPFYGCHFIEGWYRRGEG